MSKGSLFLVPSLWALSFLRRVALFNFNVIFCFILYFVYFFSLRSLFFPSERKGVNLDVRGFWEKLGGVGEKELVSEHLLYFHTIEKESIFNKRGEI